MRASRNEYRTFKGMPNVPYKPVKQKLTLGRLWEKCAPSLLIGGLVAISLYFIGG